MAKFKIIYLDVNQDDEIVEASTHRDNPPWIDFYTRNGGAVSQGLRVRADDVERIEPVTD